MPLSEDVESFFAREVKPHVPDAWIDTERRDPQDGEVGLVGYEISFNRYFYEYRPPRPIEEIDQAGPSPESRLDALDRALTCNHPTGDVDEMLAEIERGRDLR